MAVIAGPAAATQVTSFTLIDAVSDTDLQTLQDGAVLDLTVIGSSLNVRANTSGQVGSVVFGLDGNPNYRNENVAPYALEGDSNGNYNPWTPSVGAHTLTATPYTGADATGTVGVALTVNFTVVDGGFPPPTGGTGVVSGELKKWHKTTIDFAGPSSDENAGTNPFRTYRMDVEFRHNQSGLTLTAPGFFAADGNAATTSATGGTVWRVRFLPPLDGQWNYTVSFRAGTDVSTSTQPNAGVPTSIDGASGSFNISPTNKTGRDFRGQGRLEYVGEHYLRFAETSEYFLKAGADSPENFLGYFEFDNTQDNGCAGNDLTNGLHQYGPHVGDWKSGDPTWKSGLGKGIIGAANYLAGKGMNSVYFLTMNVQGDGCEVYPWTAYSERYRFDVSKLGQWEILFEHMDRVGLMMHVVTQETENDQLLDGGALGTQRKLYYRELIARFGHHPAVVWNLGEENSNTDAERKAFSDYFKALDPNDHPVVVHTYPGQYDQVYNPLLGYPSFDGPSLQLSSMTGTHAETIKWIDRSATAGRAWIVSLDEIGPSGTGVKPDADDFWHDDVRRYALWGNLMAGGAGAEWYFGYSYPHSDLDCEDWRSRDHMWDLTRFAVEFFQQYLPITEMQNADNLTSASDDYCFAKDGDTYAIYLPQGGSTNLDLTGQSGAFDIWWYNPRAGGSLQGGSVASVNGNAVVGIGSPPSSTTSDWVVLVQKATGGGNQPPSITSSPVTTATEGQSYSYDVDATDPDPGDTLTFSLQVAPSGAGIHSGTGLISWTPSAAQVGSQNFTVRVTDNGTGGLFDEQSFAVQVSPAAAASYRINAGGPAYTDSVGNAWSADFGFNTGSTFSVSDAISGTPDPTLYQSERWDSSAAPELIYSLAVTPGSYLVRLHFAEIFSGASQPGARVFDVAIEGLTVLNDFDIVADVGPLTATIKEFVSNVADTSLEISFTHVVDNPKISAIEVLQGGVPNQPPSITSSPITSATEGQPYSYDVNATDPDPGDTLSFTLQASPSGAGINTGTGLISWTPSAAQVGSQNFTVRVTDDGVGELFDEQSFAVNVSEASAVNYRINAGGPAYTDSFGSDWSADFGYNTGSTYIVGSSISGTPDEFLYQSERWDASTAPELIYSLPVNPGIYLVRLHFADIFSGTNQEGKRVFDVAIESQTMLSNFDIVAEVGPLTATVEEFVVNVANTSLEIQLTHVVDNPKISAIEILEDYETSCSDGIDNEGDGQIDCLDGDCQGNQDCLPSLFTDGFESGDLGGWSSSSDD